MKLTMHQQEILGWLLDGWELLWWDCNGRWYMGEMALDGRAVRGLRLRGLVENKPGHHPELVLTGAGRGWIKP